MAEKESQFSIALLGDSVTVGVAMPGIANISEAGLTAAKAVLPRNFSHVVLAVGGNDICTATATITFNHIQTLVNSGKRCGVSVIPMIVCTREDILPKTRLPILNELLHGIGAKSDFHDATADRNLRGWKGIHPTTAGMASLNAACGRLVNRIRQEEGLKPLTADNTEQQQPAKSAKNHRSSGWVYGHRNRWSDNRGRGMRQQEYGGRGRGRGGQGGFRDGRPHYQEHGGQGYGHGGQGSYRDWRPHYQESWGHPYPPVFRWGYSPY